MMARRVFLGILPLWVLAAALAVTWLPETFSTWEKAVRGALRAADTVSPGPHAGGYPAHRGRYGHAGDALGVPELRGLHFCGLLLHVVGHLDARGWVYALGLTTFAVRWLNVVLQLARPVPAIPWAWPGRRF